MLNQDKGHAVSGWQRAYQLSAGIKAAGRSTNRDDRELVRLGRRLPCSVRGAGSTDVGSLRPCADDGLALCDCLQIVSVLLSA